jgi:hypothetical protein
MTGALANKYGVKVMQPLIVAMLVVCILMWLIVPKKRRLM